MSRLTKTTVQTWGQKYKTNTGEKLQSASLHVTTHKDNRKLKFKTSNVTPSKHSTPIKYE